MPGGALARKQSVNKLNLLKLTKNRRIYKQIIMNRTMFKNTAQWRYNLHDDVMIWTRDHSFSADIIINSCWVRMLLQPLISCWCWCKCFDSSRRYFLPICRITFVCINNSWRCLFLVITEKHHIYHDHLYHHIPQISWSFYTVLSVWYWRLNYPLAVCDTRLIETKTHNLFISRSEYLVCSLRLFCPIAHWAARCRGFVC